MTLRDTVDAQRPSRHQRPMTRKIPKAASAQKRKHANDVQGPSLGNHPVGRRRPPGTGGLQLREATSAAYTRDAIGPTTTRGRSWQQTTPAVNAPRGINAPATSETTPPSPTCMPPKSGGKPGRGTCWPPTPFQNQASAAHSLRNSVGRTTPLKAPAAHDI